MGALTYTDLVTANDTIVSDELRQVTGDRSTNF